MSFWLVCKKVYSSTFTGFRAGFISCKYCRLWDLSLKGKLGFSWPVWKKSKSHPQPEFLFISYSQILMTPIVWEVSPGELIPKNSVRFPLRQIDYRLGLASVLPDGLGFQRFCVHLMKIRCYTLYVFTYSVPKAPSLFNHPQALSKQESYWSAWKLFLMLLMLQAAALDVFQVFHPD